MAMAARFEGTGMGAPGWIYPTLKAHLSCGAGTMASGSCSFTFTPHKRTKTHTNSHFLCPSLSSSAFLSFTLFYISVTSAYLLCSSCQLPFHALPQKCVQVNISRLLMLKGSGSSRYVTGRELSVPRAAIDKPSPSSSFHAAFIFQIMDMCDRRRAFDDAFVLFINMLREDTPSEGKTKQHCS